MFVYILVKKKKKKDWGAEIESVGHDCGAEIESVGHDWGAEIQSVGHDCGAEIVMLSSYLMHATQSVQMAMFVRSGHFVGLAWFGVILPRI